MVIPEAPLARRILQSLALLLALGVLGIVTLFLALWLDHRTKTILPTATGPFTIGRAIYDWTDDLTLDPLAPVPGTKRELLVWIWYPSVVNQSAAPVDGYLPARTVIERNTGVLLNFLTRDRSKVHVHSTRNPDVSPQQPSYPIVIMRAGASAEVWNYSTLAEDLASHGYVVVGFDAPYRTHVVVFPDGRVMERLPRNNPELCLEMTGDQQAGCVNKLITAWTSDIAFVLDRLERLNASDSSGKFTGRLDMTRVGVFGHSFGGAVALQFCSEDPRCTAAIDVDGAPHGSVIQTGFDRPAMLLLSDHGRESGPESSQILANMRPIYDHLPRNGRAFIEIRGANHFLFSDDGALLKSHLVMGTLRELGVLGIDGRRQLEVTSYCLRTFFDACLKHPSGSPPKFVSPLYPEIRVRE